VLRLAAGLVSGLSRQVRQPDGLAPLVFAGIATTVAFGRITKAVITPK
jgi:hypothetical protein